MLTDEERRAQAAQRGERFGTPAKAQTSTPAKPSEPSRELEDRARRHNEDDGSSDDTDDPHGLRRDDPHGLNDRPWDGLNVVDQPWHGGYNWKAQMVPKARSREHAQGIAIAKAKAAAQPSTGLIDG